MGIIKMIYVLTITAFLIMLVAFGISAFYEAPEYPRHDEPPRPVLAPSTDPSAVLGTPEYEEWEKAQEEWRAENQKRQEAFNEERKTYRRNVFLIAYPFGLLFVILGLQLRPRLDILKPGLLLGGFGTIIYAISQSDLSDQVRFAGVAIGLAVLIYVGYRTLLERKPVADSE